MFWANWLGRRGISLSNNAQTPPPRPVSVPKPPRKAPSHRGRPPHAKGIQRRRQERLQGHRALEQVHDTPRSAELPQPPLALAALALRAWWVATVVRFCATSSNITDVLALQLTDSRERFAAMLTALSRHLRRDATHLHFRAACRAFAVDSYADLQDLFNSLLLAETVYKVIDQGMEGAATTLRDLKACYPPGLITLSTVQWALPHVTHRYLLAESDTTLFVALMGTKQRRDMFTNANVLQEVLWEDLQEVQGAAVHKGAPAAHRGFLRRARGVPIEDLYLHAHRKGKKLLLCGHSLGGAVATLCTIRLLQHLPRSQQDNVMCIGFATPPVGNAALADLVRKAGWDRRIQNIMLPEDVIPRLLTFSSSMHNHSVSYLPQLQPGVIADELDVGDPVDAASKLATPPEAADDEQPTPPHVVPVANNILAPTLRQWRRLRRLRQHVQVRLPGQDDAANVETADVADAALAVPSTVDGVVVADPPRTPWQHNMTAVARTAGRGMSRAAQLVTSPVRATRAYVPVGRQLYVMPHNLSRTHPTTPPTPPPEGDSSPAVETVTTTQGRKRVLFHMHRMATYRGRLTSILSDTTQAPRAGAASSSLQLAQTLAPQIRPLSAMGYITSTVQPPPPPLPLASITNARTRQTIPLTGGVAASQSADGRWSWPWLQFFAAREAERAGGSGAVEVVLRVTGTGLENATVVELATGSGSSVQAQVVRKPTSTLLLPLGTVVPPGTTGGAVARNVAWPLRLLLGPVLEGWQHVKAWTGQDPLLVRAYIPAALLAQMADREQQANETTQGGYKLAVRIASDFQVIELPLKLEGNLTDDEKRDAEDRYRRIGRMFATSRL